MKPTEAGVSCRSPSRNEKETSPSRITYHPQDKMSFAVTPSSAIAEQLIIAVDGGGTKTDAWLAVCAAGKMLEVVGRGSSGPSNPRAVGLEVAQQNIQQAIGIALHGAQRTGQAVDSACLALSGVGHEPIRLQMLQWARSVPLARCVQVVHDAQAVLAAAFDDAVGVAVICGTGSFAYGVTRAGAWARAGGWGYLVGDEGSAFAIGRAALQALARAVDGRAPGTCLTDLLLKQMQLSEPAQVISALYGVDISAARESMAALAPCVFQAARAGDQVAVQICHDSAMAVSELVCGVTSQLGLVAGQYDLALAGGVLINQTEWAELCVQMLGQRHCEARRTVIVDQPVRGALKLACQ